MTAREGAWEAVLVSAMAAIEEVGWCITGVFPTAESPGMSFAYTAGLTAKRLPELIVVGLPGRLGQRLLNNAAEVAVADGAFVTGVDVTGILGNHVPVRFRRCGTKQFAVARQLYPSIQTMQMVWPDSEGRFPWEPLCQVGIRKLQPLL